MTALPDLTPGPLFTPFCSADAEARLNLFVDGELDAAEEPELFAHLAACASCRAQFNALLAFRRAVRQDRLVLPPAADERFFAALDARRRARLRAAARAPLPRRPRTPLGFRVPLGAALASSVLSAVLFLTVGLLYGDPDARPAAAPQPVVAETVAADGQVLYVMESVEVSAPRDERPVAQ